MPASLVDTSVWVAAVFPSHPLHAQAQGALAESSPEEPACFCRATQVSFLRLITTPAVLRLYGAEHMTNRAATTLLRHLQARPDVREFQEPAGVVEVWHQLAERDTVSPKVWMDAYLAAFALRGGLRVLTLDADFEAYARHGIPVVVLRR